MLLYNNETVVYYRVNMTYSQQFQDFLRQHMAHHLNDIYRERSSLIILLPLVFIMLVDFMIEIGKRGDR